MTISGALTDGCQNSNLNTDGFVLSSPVPTVLKAFVPVLLDPVTIPPELLMPV